MNIKDSVRYSRPSAGVRDASTWRAADSFQSQGIEDTGRLTTHGEPAAFLPLKLALTLCVYAFARNLDITNATPSIEAMTNYQQKVTGKQWLIATSVFATTNKNRSHITYGEFLDMLEGMKFTPHERRPGTVRPPQRFGRLPQGRTVLVYNPHNRPLDRKMSYTAQRDMKRQLRDRYRMKLADFFVEPHVEWEHPADPNNPVPIPPSLPKF
ncbi:hypothetical protein C8T65DRAFT_751418 [Cerioporus squamosus]|nr:hypothetical protein C8T65DRAFT_751418 [Cerioporus squamosus]